MIALGSKVEFKPLELDNALVTGKIVAIHPSHQWFTVEYGDENNPVRVSFKFDDYGDRVTPAGTKRVNKIQRRKSL